jgi:hypothetical protein
MGIGQGCSTIRRLWLRRSPTPSLSGRQLLPRPVLSKSKRPGPSRQKAQKILEGVKIGITFAKWGNLDENLLNGVIRVKKFKIGGKNWNSLLICSCWLISRSISCSVTIIYSAYFLAHSSQPGYCMLYVLHTYTLYRWKQLRTDL